MTRCKPDTPRTLLVLTVVCVGVAGCGTALPSSGSPSSSYPTAARTVTGSADAGSAQPTPPTMPICPDRLPSPESTLNAEEIWSPGAMSNEEEDRLYRARESALAVAAADPDSGGVYAEPGGLFEGFVFLTINPTAEAEERYAEAAGPIPFRLERVKYTLQELTDAASLTHEAMRAIDEPLAPLGAGLGIAGVDIVNNGVRIELYDPSRIDELVAIDALAGSIEMYCLDSVPFFAEPAAG